MLLEVATALPPVHSVIGLCGGQALNVAKFVAWRRRLPLFQVPTATTVDAPFGHRAAVREAGRVRYVGWAVPEAVYIDYDVIRNAALGMAAYVQQAGLWYTIASARPVTIEILHRLQEALVALAMTG